MTGIVVKSKIKEFVDGMNVATEVHAAIDKAVEDILKKAVQRARQNQRRTIQARDL